MVQVDRLQKSKSKKAEKKASKEAKKEKKRAASQMETALQFPSQGQNGAARQHPAADATHRLVHLSAHLSTHSPTHHTYLASFLHLHYCHSKGHRPFKAAV